VSGLRCTACGKPEWEKVGHPPFAATVSHLACVEKLEEQIERARSYKGIEAYPCPLCTYRDGIFIESCQMHKDMHELEATMRQAEREAAFWKWLWELEREMPLPCSREEYIANMRERFEREQT
jgi:hypothetical protein